MYTIPGKKIGIQATGSRRYGAKNDMQRGNNYVKLPKSIQNQRTNSPKRQG